MQDKSGLEPISLLIIAEKELPEYINYEPETIMEGLKISPLECEKLLACREVFQNHKTFNNCIVFEKVCAVFNGTPALFGILQEVDPAEVTYAIQCIRNIDDVSLFKENVLSYIALVFHTFGVRELPEIIKKEKSSAGISCAFLLKGLQKGGEPENEEAKKIRDDVQFQHHQDINEYLQEKTKKEMDELHSRLGALTHG